MTRLPPALMPLWPAAKRAHRAATRASGAIARRSGRLDVRSVPRTAHSSVGAIVGAEADATRVHVVGPRELIARTPPAGRPGRLVFWEEVARVDVPERFVLELDGGRLVGEYAAAITSGGALATQVSPYFGIRGWKEHPVYLRPRLPPPRDVDGTVLSLASVASGRNYYHSIMDTLPRWGMAREAFPDLRPDLVVVAGASRWDRQILELAGLEDLPRVEPKAALHLRADRLLVPAVNNHSTLAPRWHTQWLREHLRPRRTDGLPRRIYVTRGHVRHTRRYVQEAELMPHLERRGFVRVDPGALSVQEQIDQFAAAEVVVGPHGAGLVNLNFAPEGVRVLELFAPRYLNPGYWSITDNVPGSVYRYLVGDPVSPARSERRMTGVQNDVDIPVDRVLDDLDELLRA